MQEGPFSRRTTTPASQWKDSNRYIFEAIVTNQFIAGGLISELFADELGQPFVSVIAVAVVAERRIDSWDDEGHGCDCSTL